MDEMANPKRVLKGKLYAKRRIGRSRLRWMDDVTDDLRRMGTRSCTEKARNRDQWRLIVEKTKAHPGLWCRAEEDLSIIINQKCKFFSLHSYVKTLKTPTCFDP
jgi:hypothetical protein